MPCTPAREPFSLEGEIFHSMKLHDGRPKRIMTELEALAHILAYMDENIIRRALEVEAHQKLVFEATIVKIIKTLATGQNGRPKLQKAAGSTAYTTISLWGLRKTQ